MCGADGSWGRLTGDCTLIGESRWPGWAVQTSNAADARYASPVRASCIADMSEPLRQQSSEPYHMFNASWRCSWTLAWFVQLCSFVLSCSMFPWSVLLQCVPAALQTQAMARSSVTATKHLAVPASPPALKATRALQPPSAVPMGHGALLGVHANRLVSA